MMEYFVKRTAIHIALVVHFAKKMVDLGLITPDEFKEIKKHDGSKFSKIELEPYILLTDLHESKRLNETVDYVVNDKIKEEFKQARFHHMTTNKHNPLFWDKNFNIGELGSGNIVDATTMDYPSMAEMVCDWCALSQEFNKSPCIWAERFINTKASFTTQQENTIYMLINEIWRKN